VPLGSAANGSPPDVGGPGLEQILRRLPRRGRCQLRRAGRQAALLAHQGQGRNFWSRADLLCGDESERLLGSIGLAGQARAIAGTLAYGNQKQLELGIALASEPKILLLDEPTAGMSASETHEAIALIARIARERGLTLLFTEHDMAVVFSIAQQIAVMHQGRIIADGTPAAVRADAEVRRVYLGERA
jgi:branched-chain amino acid transport system ATP-binding protein